MPVHCHFTNITTISRKYCINMLFIVIQCRSKQYTVMYDYIAVLTSFGFN